MAQMGAQNSFITMLTNCFVLKVKKKVSSYLRLNFIELFPQIYTRVTMYMLG